MSSCAVGLFCFVLFFEKKKSETINKVSFIYTLDRKKKDFVVVVVFSCALSHHPLYLYYFVLFRKMSWHSWKSVEILLITSVSSRGSPKGSHLPGRANVLTGTVPWAGMF